MIIENITEFTIYEAQKLKDIFIEELENNTNFVLEMGNIQKIDMVGIQLLISLVRSADLLGKDVKFKNISQDVMDQINICSCKKALGIADD